MVLAPSILSTEQVVTSLPIQRLRRNTLFVDVLSVKVFPKQLMLANLPPEVHGLLFRQHHQHIFLGGHSLRAPNVWARQRSRCMDWTEFHV